MKEMGQLLLEQDILPTGEFEALPVVALKGGQPEAYADVVRLKLVPQFTALHTESERYIEQIGKVFIRERSDIIASHLSMEDVYAVLTDTGFVRENYQAYSLRKKGTAELEDFISGATRSFFESLEIPYFRMQYAVAEPGWRTKFHIDHRDFKTHGFRAMVPLGSPVIMSFLNNGIEDVYELEPGAMYFVNIAKFHRGFNPHPQPRTNLIFQMASDASILSGAVCAPISPGRKAAYQTYLSNEVARAWK